MQQIPFELSNEQRKYLGLNPVEKGWDLVKLSHLYLYFDGDIIRKKISSDGDTYFEEELFERTAENRTILLPKTAKGKPRKLNFTATQSFSAFGIYFSFKKGSSVSIANCTTQTTYFSEGSDEADLGNLEEWLNRWIAESTEADLKEIEAYKTAARKHYKYKEGDFFAFRIGRRKWGFGRILIDIAKLTKSDEFKEKKNYGLAHLMGRALLVKVYHKISSTLDIDLDELSTTMALPSQPVMDNHYYYGENKIIGHKPLLPEEYDMLISYSRSISSHDTNTVYLQYGLIYRETTVSDFNKYLVIKREGTHDNVNPYRNEGIGFGLNTRNLEKCIQEKSNDSFWDPEHYTLRHDLRNPANKDIKREIFSFFGLNADLDYSGNLKLLSN